MGNEAAAMHFVCTLAEARELTTAREEYWVSNCGCREGRGGCSRSRLDLCLMFGDMPASGSGKKRISRADVDAILREATEKHLVARPFRNDDRTAVDGICFCCDDCCGYFLDPSEACDRGRTAEATDLAACTHCAACAAVCHFGARDMKAGQLVIERENCYGCGLCLDVCPEDCIEMVPRG